MKHLSSFNKTYAEYLYEKQHLHKYYCADYWYELGGEFSSMKKHTLSLNNKETEKAYNITWASVEEFH